MPGKKSAKPQKSDAEKALERRVDVIMSTESTSAESAVSVPVTKKASAKKPAAKASKGQKTAPPLPAKLLKKAKPDKAPEPKPEPEAPADPPIVIALADETDEAEAPPEPVSQDASDTEDDAATDPEPQAETEWAQDPSPEADNLLEDSATDEAVDEIVAKESDAVLALDDALAARKERLSAPVQAGGLKHKWLWFLGFIVVVGTVVDYLIFTS